MASFDKINDLLQQEVSRKEFLRFVGVALLGLLGVTSMLNNLNLVHGPHRHAKKSGYGMSAYGR